MTLPNFPQNMVCPKCESENVKARTRLKSPEPVPGGDPPGPMNPPDLGADNYYVQWNCQNCGYWTWTRTADA